MEYQFQTSKRIEIGRLSNVCPKNVKKQTSTVLRDQIITVISQKSQKSPKSADFSKSHKIFFENCRVSVQKHH